LEKQCQGHQGSGPEGGTELDKAKWRLDTEMKRASSQNAQNIKMGKEVKAWNGHVADRIGRTLV
jgi:hypothetical protein